MRIAIINNREISSDEYQAELYHLLQKSHQKTITQKLKEQALNKIIDTHLLLDCISLEKISVTDSEVDAYVQTMQNRYLSLAEFNNMVATYYVSLKGLKQRITHVLQMKQYIATAIRKDIHIDEQMLHNYYDEHKQQFETKEAVNVCHINIATDDPYCYDKITTISERLFRGEPFCSIAKEFSRCPSAQSGGRLGYISRGTLIDELENIVFALPIGKIAGPIRSSFGYHFITVTDRRPSRVPEYDELKEIMREQLEKMTAELEVLSRLRTLRSRASITIFREKL